MIPFLEQIRSRKMVRWLVFYLAASWVCLQVLDFFGSHFRWPEWVIPSATALLAAGLVAAIIISWYHGEKGHQTVSRTEALLLGATVIFGLTGSFAARRHSIAVEAATPSDESIAVASDIPEASVAVLPFVNLSGLKENQYFSDGITEEILNALAKIEGLHVAGRTSAFAVRDDTADTRTIGRRLGVVHVLMGSVQRAGENARISAKLIDTRTGFSLWSDRYDRKLSDIFAVEDEISRAIAEQLSKTLASNVVLTSSGTKDVGAHDLYLLGLERWNTRSPASLRQALDHFNSAIRKDSAYAQAWAGAALAHVVLPQYDPTVDAVASIAASRRAAMTALRIDPQSAEAHAALSQCAELSNELKTAEQEARIAISLKPSYMTAHQWLGESLFLQGRHAEGLAEATTAVQLDRLSAVAQNLHAFFLSAMGRTDESMESVRLTLQIDPGFTLAIGQGVVTMLIAHRYTDAEALGLRAALTSKDTADARAILAGYSDVARKHRATELLVSGRGSTLGMNPAHAMGALEVLGARSEALAMARSQVHDPSGATYVRFVLSNERLTSLRDDPRMPREYKPGLNR